MDSTELVKYNAWGLIPGPTETEEEFQKRVDYCLNLKKILSDELTPKDSLPLDSSREEEVLKQPLQISSQFYGFSPTWVPIFFSNFRLMPWQGAATWIFQIQDESPTGAFVQMRKSFYDQGRYLGLYDRGELLVHELCHVGRMAYAEPKYEELLAYRTSMRPFTKYLGAIVQSAAESRFFLILLLAILAIDTVFLYYGALQAYLNAMWLKLLPLALIIWGIIRLQKRQKTLQKTVEKLSLLNDQPEAILFRLTDAEIDQFAASDLPEIHTYIQQDTSLRWKMIRSAYF